jgi:uncharacterized membrane protein YccF (DUF307 family)
MSLLRLIFNIAWFVLGGFVMGLALKNPLMIYK